MPREAIPAELMSIQAYISKGTMGIPPDTEGQGWPQKHMGSTPEDGYRVPFQQPE
jgi:hypothetical protein